MYYSAIGILALLILLIENQDIILLNRKGAFDSPAWKVYRRFLISVLVYDVSDILWGVIEQLKLARLLFIDTSVYFVAMAAGILFWTQYAVTYLEEKNAFGRFLIFAGRTIAALVVLFTGINIFKPVLFTVDEACVYHALGARYGLLIAQIFLLLLIMVFTLSVYIRRRAKNRMRYRTLALFGLIMAALLFAQIWYPYLPLYAIAYMLATCLLRAFVIGDEKEAYRHKLEETEKISNLKQSITSLLDNMPALSFSKDAETGVYLACNQAFAEYANKPDPKGVVGLTDAQIFDPATAKHFVEDDRMALTMDEPYIFFENVPDAAGNPKQLQTTKLKFIDAAGRLCILGMSQDVTDMVRIRREHATTKEAYEKARSAGVMYTRILQTLVRSYTDLYYVDLETEAFIEYTTDDKGFLRETRRGESFFDACKADVKKYIYPDDRDFVLMSLERQSVLSMLAKNTSFMLSYRLLRNGKPTYVSMNLSQMEDDKRYIIIAVKDIDEQIKQQRAMERIKEERTAYARLSALMGDFICVYLVAPETGRYREYSATAGYETFALPKEGTDFFGTVREQGSQFVYSDDRDRFLSLFTKKDVLSEVKRNGIFLMSYRLVIGGRPTYVQLKAAMIKETEGDRLIVGVNNVDAQVRQEASYTRRLEKAQSKANLDALTGFKNKFAYQEVEKRLDRRIEEDRPPTFAIVILDVNDLKKVNDTLGHQAGDQYLRDAGAIISGIFDQSSVFRIGGDEFAVIVQGKAYALVDDLLEKVHAHNEEAVRSGGIVIACGMAKYDRDDDCVASVFRHADQKMYENKSSLKAQKNG